MLLLVYLSAWWLHVSILAISLFHHLSFAVLILVLDRLNVSTKFWSASRDFISLLVYRHHLNVLVVPWILWVLDYLWRLYFHPT